MSGSEAANSSYNENLCVVCFKNVEIYSIGVCDHPVCFECSTRMRVLCKQNECPICRQDMPKVIFTRTIEPFLTLFPKFERSNLQDRKFGLYFCTSDIQKAYYKILEHRCHICEEGERKWPFKTFQQLKDHMRREHELFYCDICVDNLKIFTFERRCYTRQELGHHRRKGDPDNTSHRGHPLCEFCDTRYMDSDELFRHLRRNHLFCHFCDADGKHQYYNDMEDLRRHFRDEHYLCEEGECKTLPMTAVFRTDIDLKAHITTEHSRHMSKSATKQARTLELEFTLAPRPRSDNLRNKRFNERRDRYDEENLHGGYNMEPGGPGGGNEGGGRLFVNPLTPQDFPALGNSSSITLQSRPTTTVNFTSKMNSGFSGADFPSLGASSNRASPAVTITTNSSAPGSNRAPEVTITRTVRGQQGLAKTMDNFPTLGSNSSSSGSTVRLSVNNSQDPKAPKVSIHVNHRPNGSLTTHITTSSSSSTQQRPVEAFPVLGSGTKPAQPMWVQAKSKKQEAKNMKVAPAPQLPPSTLDQFPSLAKKKSSVTVPVSNTWVNLNSINNASSRNPGSGDNKKSDSKPSSVKQKQPDFESRLQELALTESNDSKNKNKKKKNRNISDVDSSKQNKPNKTNESKPSKTLENNKTNENKSAKPSGFNDKVNNNESDSQNGLIKKRSELKIGTLTNSGESNTISSSDFPVLGETKPPPGFNVKPPPGFTPGSFPTLGVANDLTFTSSSGQSYAITPSSSTYRPPNNFQSRNQNLIKSFMSVLKNNEAIKEFKNYSDLFRNGVLPTRKYYDHCKEVLGSSFDDIFPELLVLLPDIDKERELYDIYDGKNKKNLIACENCKQIIFKRELSEHYNYHSLDNHFPSLGSVQQTNNVWKKIKKLICKRRA
ncbi:hypothetical protein NQ315_004480, partial [Exocentrus adspersus]